MNLLKLNDLTESQIQDIFGLAEKLKCQGKVDYLKGKTFLLFFPETSIRTRITFEKGIQDLGGNCILFPPETLDKREKIEDVVKYIENWADGIIVRHREYSKIEEMAKYCSIPVINAMTSTNHPCEILSDLFSISQMKNNYKDLNYTFVGAANNISRSWKNVANVLNLKYNHVCTKGNELGVESENYKFHTNIEDVLLQSDVVLTDSLPKELKTNEYLSKYQITLERMNMTKKNAILNPCPPFFRDDEVSEDIILSDYFVGYEFKKNLLFVQQAIILYCSGLSDVQI